MAGPNIIKTQAVFDIQQSHSRALKAIQRNKKVVIALRALTESKLEKGLVLAVNETVDDVHKEIIVLGGLARKLEEALKDEQDNHGGVS